MSAGRKVRSAKAVTVIGGADGPTSIFLAGSLHGKKEKNIIRRVKNRLQQARYERKRMAVQKSITAGAHTMEELMLYIRQRYQACEAGESYPDYFQRKRQMKHELIRLFAPELLGEERDVPPPEDFSDQKAVSQWLRKVESQNEEYLQQAEQIPEEMFPSEYHLFLIEQGEDGTMELELDAFYPKIGISWSGKKERMEPIVKDVYRYLGVSQQDIEQKTDRYQTLLTVLSAD